MLRQGPSFPATTRCARTSKLKLKPARRACLPGGLGGRSGYIPTFPRASVGSRLAGEARRRAAILHLPGGWEGVYIHTCQRACFERELYGVHLPQRPRDAGPGRTRTGSCAWLLTAASEGTDPPLAVARSATCTLLTPTSRVDVELAPSGFGRRQRRCAAISLWKSSGALVTPR